MQDLSLRKTAYLIVDIDKRVSIYRDTDIDHSAECNSRSHVIKLVLVREKLFENYSWKD